MPSNSFRQETPPPTGDARAERRHATALTPLWYLCACLCLALASVSEAAPQAAGAQSPPQQTRPRTVTEKSAAPTPTPAPSPAAPAASQPESQEVGDDEVVRVNSNLVLVPASVVDSHGRAITDLKLEDFELRVDGEVQTISDLNRAETPVHVALLFDNSASLSAARTFEKQAATRFFASVVRPIDRAAVYSVSTQPTLEQPFTNDVPRLVRTIERFGQPEGATALFDAVEQAAYYLRPITGRKVIVVVSDGTDTVSNSTFDQSLQTVLRADCQVYVVQTRQLEDPNSHDLYAERQLAKLTEQTGGAVFVPQAVEDLDAVFTQISRDLAEQYVLSYYPQDVRKDKYFRFIALRVKTRPNLRVRARRGFYPNSAQNQSDGTAAPVVTRTSEQASQRVTAQGASSIAQEGSGLIKTAERTSLAGSAAHVLALNRRAGPEGPSDDTDAEPRSESADAPTPAPAEPLATEHAQVNSEPAHAPASNEPLTVIRTSANDSPAAKAAPAESNAKASAPESHTERTAISGGVLNGKALSLPPPMYPTAARNTGAAGTVVVQVTIDERGKVISAHALSGHPLLQQAAVSAAKLARFSPTLLSGAPVKVTGTINYTFSRP